MRSPEEARRFTREARRLSALWRKRLGLPGFITPIEARHEKENVYVRARAVSGVVPVGRFNLSIAPKYLEDATGEIEQQKWEAAFARMLSRSGSDRYTFASEVEAQASVSGGFVDLLARAYTRALGSALEDGLPRTYESRTEWLSSVRGRLLTERMYPQVLYAPHKVPCEFDEYVSDTPVTRLLKWAAIRFGKLATGNQLANRLRRLVSLMPEVASRAPSSLLAVDRLTLSPQYRHCEPALRIARWLAEGKGGQPTTGQAELPGLLLHSDRIFESFTDAVLRAACRRKGLRYRKKEEKLSKSHGGISTKPDGQVLENGDPIIVVDAKYKEWEEHPKTTDLYQVMAGSRVLGCGRSALVYPFSSRRKPVHWSIEGEGNPRFATALFIAPVAMTEPGSFSKIAGEVAQDLDAVLGRCA